MSKLSKLFQIRATLIRNQFLYANQINNDFKHYNLITKKKIFGNFSQRISISEDNINNYIIKQNNEKNNEKNKLYIL